MTQIAIGLYPGFTALDFIGPYQVFTLLPGAEVVLCAAEPGPVPDDVGLLRLTVPASFDAVPAPDVLLVPGGLHTTGVIAGQHPVIGWVRRAHQATTWTASVCTGSLILGAAGLLRGLPATTHWSAYAALAGYGAAVTRQRVVTADKIVTGAGVSAGIDLALALAARIAGEDTAQAIQLGIEYDPQPPFAAGSPGKAPAAVRDLVASLLEPAAGLTPG